MMNYQCKCAIGVAVTLLATTSQVNAQYIQKLAYSYSGDSFAERFGISVANAGDVNNDGYDDVIIGAHQDMENGLFAVGSVSVISGFDGSLLYKRIGDAANDRLGTKVAGAGDINNDGYDDFMAGAPNANSSKGYMRVYSGADGSTLHTIVGEHVGDKCGFSIAGIGDINNDNLGDFVVGEPAFDFNNDPLFTFAGRIRVISGTGALLYTYNGKKNYSLGSAVASVGDVDLDGVPDFAGSAPNAIVGFTPFLGFVRVYSGDDGSLIREHPGDISGADYGSNIVSAGDVNSDGHPDYAVSAPNGFKPNDFPRQGRVRLYSGKDGSLIWQWWDPDEWSNLGDALSGGSDVNGDGYFDIGVGAPFHDENVQYDGSVAICSTAGTPSDDAPCSYSWHGSDAQERFGHGLSTDGDLNGDGIGDVVIGAPRALVGGVAKGAVSVYVSTPGYCDGDANADGFVDTNDISYVIFRLGNSGAPGIPGDVNVDAVVDVNDLSYVIARNGTTCP